MIKFMVKSIKVIIGYIKVIKPSFRKVINFNEYFIAFNLNLSVALFILN